MKPTKYCTVLQRFHISLGEDSLLVGTISPVDKTKQETISTKFERRVVSSDCKPGQT